MMVVVVETWKHRWIKGESLQHIYNQGILGTMMGLHLLGCTHVVTSSPRIYYAFNQTTTTTRTLKMNQQ